MKSIKCKEPWLSVIVPIYNAERYLRKCIDSVLMQSFFDFELILVDDGSTDSSASICKSYSQKDKRIKYFYKENGGGLQARVFGTENSSGLYFTYCDADDYYASSVVFQTIHDEITKHKCTLLQFSYIKKYNHLSSKISINTNSAVSHEKFYNTEFPKLLCSFSENASLTNNVWNKVYCSELKSALPSYKSFDRVFWGDDLIMNLYLLEECDSALFITDTLYIYRQFSGGTNEFSIRTMQDLNTIKHYQFMFIDRYYGEKKDAIIKLCYLEIAGWIYSYVKQGIKHLDEEKLKQLLSESLELPVFKKAREFYFINPQLDNEAIALLKLSDTNEYIRYAKNKTEKETLRNKLKAFLIKVYKSI